MANTKDEKISFWASPPQGVFDFLKSSEKGLTDQEAGMRLQGHGFNELASKERRHGLRQQKDTFLRNLRFGMDK